MGGGDGMCFIIANEMLYGMFDECVHPSIVTTVLSLTITLIEHFSLLGNYTVQLIKCTRHGRHTIRNKRRLNGFHPNKRSIANNRGPHRPEFWLANT